MKFFQQIIIIFFLFWVASANALANLSASVDRTDVSYGDTFQLKLVLTDPGNQQAISPEFSNLQQDFSVVAVEQGSEFSDVNGVTKQTYHWLLTLSPKKAGKLLIPSVKIATQISEPIVINVSSKQSANSSLNSKAPVFLETKITRNETYVQSPVLYTLKVYYNRDITSPNVVPPTGQNVSIYSAGPDDSYQTVINHKSYQVFVRNYFVVADKEGHYTLEPALFEGQIVQPSRDFFYNFSNAIGKPFQLVGKRLDIQVKGIPSSYQGWWLPAKNVTISQKWQTSFEHPRVGEAYTSIITINATGVRAEQLPPLDIPKINGMNVYQEKPILKTDVLRGELYATSETKLTYIPTMTGSVNLPSLLVTWWDVVSDAKRNASLPSVTFQVIDNPNIAHNNTMPSSQSALAQPVSAKQTEPLKAVLNKSWYGSMNIPIIAGFALVLLSLLVVIIKKKFFKIASAYPIDNSEAKLNHSSETPVKNHDNRDSLRLACQRNDAKDALNAFIRWFNEISHANQYKSLAQILPLLKGVAFHEELLKLEQYLYSKDKSEWAGQAFWDNFTSYGEKEILGILQIKGQNSDPYGFYQ